MTPAEIASVTFLELDEVLEATRAAGVRSPQADTHLPDTVARRVVAALMDTGAVVQQDPDVARILDEAADADAKRADELRREALELFGSRLWARRGDHLTEEERVILANLRKSRAEIEAEEAAWERYRQMVRRERESKAAKWRRDHGHDFVNELSAAGDEAAWAELGFTDEQRDAWLAHHMRRRDAHLARQCEDAEIEPADLAKIVGGMTVLELLESGTPAMQVAAQLTRVRRAETG